ncbi:PepSY domain-containing protein [Altererythrobacter sp. KTW20L]|uniref:PepSY-associated TM helix domain-containing protein n=1 Tax=Altererythrobacter sp. KTW20L TaxID=2942210 RepID=UPI0020C06D3F|nr:PepSY domain-containing protein [Altererythrobacter sp. KTW20L]MCL6252080.1 PepSY domain-containing protein [Altererythrobacter sp. KTW20L]
MRQQGDRLRRAVRKLHLWLGLGLGGLLVLLGLTGSVLVFYPELDALLHPEIRMEGTAPPDWDRALETVRAEYPDKPGPWRFEVTGRPGAIPARYYNPPEREGHAFRPMMVWLSPDGSQVLRRDYWGEYAMTFVYDLHYRLLLGTTGAAIVGWAGLPLLALLLSGLWAWWPRAWSRDSWGKALRFKRDAHRQRVLRDWHKLAGLWGSLFLVLLTGTGVMLALPDESIAVLGAASLPVDPAPHVHAVESGSAPVRPSQAVIAAASALPDARLAWIETPPVAGGSYRLRMQVPGDPSYRFPHSYVWVDGASGRVLAVQDVRQAAGGSTVNNWLHPLHDGSAGGLAGRVLAVLAGLVPLALLITGWLRWRMRRRKVPAALA